MAVYEKQEPHSVNIDAVQWTIHRAQGGQYDGQLVLIAQPSDGRFHLIAPLSDVLGATKATSLMKALTDYFSTELTKAGYAQLP